jgi:aryl-alcohol dehydrogenase-like predicted oxidoreductase
MELRYLGLTGIEVSTLGFGTVTFGDFEPFGTTELSLATRLVDRCIDAGVNLFDTADGYARGQSEELLGRALAGKRDRVLLSTKAHSRMSAEPNDVGASRHHLIRSCEASLRRLGTDWIDIYHLHAFDARTSLDETLPALDDLVRAGKVRYVGCSNYSAWHLMKALAVSDRRNLVRLTVLQAYYSLVARELEWELIPLCLDQHLGLVAWSPLAGGFLSGKFERDTPPLAGTRRAGGWTPGYIDESRGFAIVDEATRIARERGRSVAEVAINWVLGKPGITSALIGARNEQQLEQNLSAAEWSLSTEEMARLEHASATPLPYPYWHQNESNQERLPPLGARS